MFTVLFIFYFLILSYLLTRIKFIRVSGITTNTILLLFAIKIVAGIAVGLVSYYLFRGHTDYQTTNNYGVQEYESLLKTPQIFFTDIFKSNYADAGAFFGSENSYWNDLRFNIIYKILAFTNILSRGNYYINSLFFNFISFLSSIALYKVFMHIYPTKKWCVIAGCFLLPSTLYFSSGIHKDLIVLAALSVFCYSLYFSLLNRFSCKNLIYLFLSFITILLIRNFIAVILLPCALVWVICKKYNYNIIKGFICLLITGIICTFTLKQFYENADPLSVVVQKQQAFFSLGTASTDYQMDSLQPTILSFVKQAPSALLHSFLSPYPGEFHNFYTNLFAFEIIAYWFLFLLAILSTKKKLVVKNEFILFGIVFVFLIFLFTGYITTNAGALVRYRSIYFPFLIVPILCNINWQIFTFDKLKVNLFKNP